MNVLDIESTLIVDLRHTKCSNYLETQLSFHVVQCLVFITHISCKPVSIVNAVDARMSEQQCIYISVTLETHN